MGSGVGVHKEEELKNLTPEQRAQLKEEVIRLLQSSEEIRKIFSSDPTLLETLTTRYPDIREILRKGVRPTYDKFQKK